jgi:uncharacterized protein involved in high-affinity Fe2+ transport
MNGQTNREDDMNKTALLLLISGTAFAQQSVIDHCKTSSSDADRIACLEAALLGKEVPAAADAKPEVEEMPEVAAGEVVEVAAVSEAVPDAEPEGIGAEQVIARNHTIEDRDESLERATGLAIASYDWVPYERLIVTLENGQVWRQIKGDTNRIRTSLERNQTADISKSGVGGYKLRLNEIRRTIRVERIR